MIKRHLFAKNFFTFFFLTFVGVFFFFNLFIEKAYATTGGQMTLYLQRENSSASTTYNTLTLSPPSPTTLTTSATVVSKISPVAPCEAANMSGNTINSIEVDDDTSPPGNGDNCLATFFSMPVGQTIAVNATDTLALAAEMYGSNTTSDNANTNFILRVYKYDGTAFIQFGSVTLGDLNAGVTNQKLTASSTPSASIILNPEDKIVVVLSLNIISVDTSGGSDLTRVNFGSTVAPSFLRLSYTALTPSKPDLTGAKDDDFNTTLNTTNCTNGGTAYNTKWTCITPSGTTLGTINAHATSSEWLILRDKEDGTLGANFGASPENTYIFQTVDTNADGEGAVSTVINSTINANNGITPFYHSGLLLWASNTDYIAIEATFDGNNRGVIINNSGALSTSTPPVTAVSSYNLIWLRYSKTGTDYQPQYSTDGANWVDIGSAIAHPTTFTRVGLTVYTAEINTEYAGAFEWFDYNIAPKFTQSAYRWFHNNDGTGVGMPLASQDTIASSSIAGDDFRLRLLIHATGKISTSSQQFKLQFSEKGTGSCASPSDVYADIATTTAIAFKNNSSAADGAALAATSTDPIHGDDIVIGQTYEELNPFANDISTISQERDGKWDFSLFDNGAPENTTYCLRAVKDDASLMNAYSVYPQIKTFGKANITSSADQVFEIGQSATAISMITVSTVMQAAINTTSSLRIGIATSTVDMRWDTNDTLATFGGSASSKVANSVSYERDGSVLVITVNSDFAVNDTLTISDLSFSNFNTVTASAFPLVLYLDGPADYSPNAVNDKVIVIKGKIMLGESTSGQELNKFQVSENNILNAELFSFKLTSVGENMNTTQLVTELLGIKGFKCSDFSNIGFYIDANSNGIIDPLETTIGGTPSCLIDGVLGTGSFTFPTPFVISIGSQDHILKSDVSSVNNNNTITLSLFSNSLSTSGVISGQPITFGGTVDSANHFKFSLQGGGGGGTEPLPINEVYQTPTTTPSGGSSSESGGGGAATTTPNPDQGGGGGDSGFGPLGKFLASIISFFKKF